jgi:hypothetical protein
LPSTSTKIVVPITYPYDTLVFRRRPNHPPAPVLGVYARRVMHHFAVNLKLHPLCHIRGSRFEFSMEEDAAVAVAHALETQGKLKVFVVFVSLQIPVVLGQAFSVDQPIFYRPALLADPGPPVQIVSVE